MSFLDKMKAAKEEEEPELEEAAKKIATKKKPAKKKPKLSAKLKEKGKEKPKVEKIIKEPPKNPMERKITATKKAPKKTPKKAPKKTPKAAAKKAPKHVEPKEGLNSVTVSDNYKESYIVNINGGDGTGKSKMALLFPKSFIMDMEFKILDTKKYDPDFHHLKEGVDFKICIAFDENGEEDQIQTNQNVYDCIDWYKTEGHKTKDTFIIDVGKAVWDAEWGAKEQEKGSQLGQPEYFGPAKAMKKWLKPFINWCRTHGKNLIIISHWGGIYVDKDAWTKICIGFAPDIKPWIRDLVSWRVDMLKPDVSGHEGRFIADFQKAPGKQYYKLDLTDKSLYEIISDPEKLDAEKKNFLKMEKIKKLQAKKQESK